MQTFRYWLLGVLTLILIVPASAHINPELHNKPNSANNNTAASYREDCTTPKNQVDQGPNRLTGGKINNVRARLRTGGDPWWDGEDGKYIVPAVDPGQTEVSSIFAGGVWLGGFDPGGSLKVACQTYGNPNGDTDFWTGPLDPVEGTTDLPICQDWDRFFEVYGTEIDEHLRLYDRSVLFGEPYTPEMIPKGVKGWPAKGNEFFFDINEFELPNTNQGLAGFYDRDGDTNYEPLDGDYPIIEIRGCEEPQYPDQMIFWIYNDNGGIHSETMGDAIQMEVQVQAFAYGTNDEINDMTFQRYKLINRAIEDIDSTFFAMWVDADLGCYTDDYIGCDVDRSLAYTYNADAQDGDVGITCPDGVTTYGNNIPIVGVDYFRGPLRPFFADPPFNTILDTLIEIGMSSFTYYNNGSVNNPPPGTSDPNTAVEFYRYLSGSWRDGSPFTFGDDAYQDGAPIEYAFTEPPNQQGGWSMCEEDLPEYDRRTVQASGPFLLQPGAVNELIIGVTWVPDLDYPCPDITRLFLADDLAQNLFDNCFELTDGPDAPDVDLIELDRKLILVLTNDTLTSNNAYELYEELDLLAPKLDDIDSTYNFEGYTIYQLADATVTRGDYSNPDKARIVANVDVKNGVSEIFNWTSVPDPGSEEVIWVPESQVAGTDEGIRHSFQVTEDQFASGDRRLINHKKYYYSAIAYAYNNWRQYDVDSAVGQRRAYLEGRNNIKTYTAIPRPIVDRTLQSDYGDGPVITRIDGIGVGGNFIDLSEETKLEIVEGSSDGTLTYRGGRGPIDVQVYNPLEVVDGEYLITFVDDNLGNNQLDGQVNWLLKNISDPGQEDILSEFSIDRLNEQIVAKYGFTVTIAQTGDVGQDPFGDNGTIGYEEEYADVNKPFWLSGVRDDLNSETWLNYCATRTNESDQALDPNQALSTIGPGYFTPYQICDYRTRPGGTPYVTPAFRDPQGVLGRAPGLLQKLNNVDIVFTSNKDLWSRCVIVESASTFYKNDLGLPTEGDADQFDLRARPSVGKGAGPDGLPAPDGEKDNSGADRIGMGWFPGYAIDVETGKRLNIFFGENTAYDCSLFCETYDNGQTPTLDMMFNPSAQLELILNTFTTVFNFIGGGQHFVYVTSTEYDRCETIYNTLKNAAISAQKAPVLQNITWCGWPMLQPGTEFLSYEEGLIPNDLTVKLRVDNPYQVSAGTNDFNGYPTYQMRLEGLAPTELTDLEVESALDLINVVPNPYYAFSEYETEAFTTTVKITNLPAKCVVTIYTLDGKFIRRYDRDEAGMAPNGTNRGIRTAQPIPDIEWDLKNNKGIPISAGVYLIHVDAEGLGERTLKWFGTNRQFDPSGL